MTPQEREREARSQMYRSFHDLYNPATPMDIGAVERAVDALLDARSARVRWEQQADAEGYTEGRP